MSGLVEQIQADAVNVDIPVSNLLRKVKIAAVKLGLDEAFGWVDEELSGYAGTLPEYRMGTGRVVAWNPYRGWIPVLLQDPETNKLLSTVQLREAVSIYEALVQKDGPFRIALSDNIVSALNEAFELPVARIEVELGRGLLINVIERVRDMVLDWALKLSRAGVTGDGLSFSAVERDRAAGAQISIGSFHGSFNAGDAIGANPRITQGGADNSTNLASDRSVFGDVEQAVRDQITDSAVRDAVLQANREMEASRDPNALLAAYQRFITAAANHMTVIGPFLPAIGTLLAQH